MQTRFKPVLMALGLSLLVPMVAKAAEYTPPTIRLYFKANESHQPDSHFRISKNTLSVTCDSIQPASSLAISPLRTNKDRRSYPLRPCYKSLNQGVKDHLHSGFVTNGEIIYLLGANWIYAEKGAKHALGMKAIDDELKVNGLIQKWSDDEEIEFIVLYDRVDSKGSVQVKRLQKWHYEK